MLILLKDKVDNMSNELFIKNLINLYPNLNKLNIQNNILSYNNLSVLLNNIDLETFFKKNTKLSQDLSILTSSKLFKIIACHSKINSEKKLLFNIDKNVIIKGMRVVNHKDLNGIIKKYLYIIDENEMTYIEQCDYALEAFDYYQSKVKENNFNQLTIYMLNEYLKELDNKKYNYDEIYELYEIKDYLLSPLKEMLDNYINNIKELEKKENKSFEEEKIINQFYEYKNKIDEDMKMIRKKKDNVGYFNGFIIIGIVTFLGVVLSILLFKGLGK